MAAATKPGPLGTNGNVSDLNDGTLVRNLSPFPGSTGGASNFESKHPQIARHRERRPHHGLPILRLGAKGEQVRWAQLLLNLHSAANPPLKADGSFGAKTSAAVVSFQRSQRLHVDGVIGIATWAKLVVTGGASPGSALSRDSLQPIAGSSMLAGAGPVADWPLTARFQKVLELAFGYLSPELAAQFRAMRTPQNIRIAVGTLAVWAVSQAFGVGEIADVLLLVVGAAFVGLASFKAGEDLGDCLIRTLHAREIPDLEAAADSLAQAVVILGIIAFFVLLAKVAARFARAGGPAGEDAAGSSAGATTGDSAPPPSTPRPPRPASTEEALGEPPKPPKPVRPPDPIAAKLENSVFNGVEADRIRPGTSGKVAVIGRSMKSAVGPYGEGLDAEGYKPETFAGDKIPPDALAEWNLLKKQYAPNPIPDDVVRSSQMFQANQAWAQKLADQGYTVVDVDNPNGDAASPFYEMEKQSLFGGGGEN